MCARAAGLIDTSTSTTVPRGRAPPLRTHPQRGALLALITAASDGQGKDRPQYFAERFDRDEGPQAVRDAPHGINPAVATWGIYGSAREIHQWWRH